LAKLVSTHPFAVLHGGQLSLSEWSARMEKVEAEMNALQPPKELEEKKPGDATVDTALLDDETVIEQQQKHPSEMTEEERIAAVEKAQAEAATAEALNKLQLTKRYYTEALKFIDILHTASEKVCQLLSSQNKSEVVEAMDFFVILDAYKIETARTGIRRMLRLIWTKGNSDEGKGVQAHLMDCYKGLFFDAPDSFSPNDAANYIARNMISLTFGATPAELTSLEQLLSVMMKEKLISEMVVQKLWQVYGVQKREVSKTQRRGAIIVLGMIAIADSEIVIKELETCLRIGLGEYGRRDLALARYTCVAIRRVNPTASQLKNDQKIKGLGRLPNDNPVLASLASIVELVSDSKEWFGVAEQAIGAIYALAKHPDVLCSEILRRKTKYVFAPDAPKDPDAMEVDMDQEEDTRLTKEISSSARLSQLLFIVGHVAIKQIVHLELCEMDFKRRKAEKEASKSSAKTPRKSTPAPEAPPTKGRKKGSTKPEPEEDQDELDLIAGTTEDDFTEALAHIRERELLYGANSLLSNYAPLVTELCANNTSYPDPVLQSQAALCMAKLMCVSSEFCESNLGLLITILERSGDPTVRSNLVIALGDMAVCFNHLIDENTDFLYRRLNDDDTSVKRTCLMTLTFLILAGQVKVKGQLGEMAKCTEDEDQSIRDMSRMFFTELATKDNAVYNHFMDMFSLLTADQSLDAESFKNIVGFLTSFIEKVCSSLPQSFFQFLDDMLTSIKGKKHSKQLREKLAVRLQRCETQRQWNDIAFALTSLKDRERDKEDTPIEKLLAEGFKVVQTQA
jgi:condensin complex subunit 1